MSGFSRRKALGTAAASLLAGTALRKAQGAALRGNGGVGMTLAEFREANGETAIPDLFAQMDCATLAMCHKEMREKHGIWIPELVPLFEKIDMLSGADAKANAST